MYIRTTCPIEEVLQRLRSELRLFCSIPLQAHVALLRLAMKLLNRRGLWN